MTVAALYDIHGNLPALEAVLDDVRGASVERIVVGGDVSPGPMSRESLELLLNVDVPVQFIVGNGDREVLATMRGTENAALPAPVREMIRWTGLQLDPEHARLMSGWPQTATLEIPEVGRVLFCHATPQNDVDIFTRLTPEERLTPIFEQVDSSVVVCGHTHMQFDRTIAGVRVVNAGSVGMPFGERGAYWLLLGPGVEFRRTTYDFTKAAERVRDTAFPNAAHFAESSIIAPAAEAVMLAAYGKVGLN